MLLLPGCALFQVTGDASKTITSPREWFGTNADADDGPTLSTARLEASIVTRPANDERIRQHVWLELDESGLMAPDRRQRLNQSGFRVAVCKWNDSVGSSKSGTRSPGGCYDQPKDRRLRIYR